MVVWLDVTNAYGLIQHSLRDIITGCTISAILFVQGMNLVLKAAEKEIRGPKMASGITASSNRSFMDDTNIPTQYLIQAR